ncbi:hypothetical protein SEA_EYEBALL_81 [Mycobacterium phage Eyeball]|nr:hypothetical protein SEA_EYEBALL_81 [Mycobacterium phage Eyeball]
MKVDPDKLLDDLREGLGLMTLSDAVDLINAERVKWLRFCEEAARSGDKEDCLIGGARARGLADALAILAKVVP